MSTTEPTTPTTPTGPTITVESATYTIRGAIYNGGTFHAPLTGRTFTGEAYFAMWRWHPVPGRPTEHRWVAGAIEISGPYRVNSEQEEFGTGQQMFGMHDASLPHEIRAFLELHRPTHEVA